ncbi:hypothetical protein BDQ12DRAFT_722549 [Crucibulum laeve]|uniref:Uncharacterized protein n=1 Tax=Crucibulum laeve TaxID=68775 RepID=A0A5C3M5Q0_9AGAR|nr:hypothetical protein BDQ12DRAFT_722549 [Crucibulum laeve]
MTNISDTRNRNLPATPHEENDTALSITMPPIMNEAEANTLPAVKEETNSSASSLNATHGVKHRPSYSVLGKDHISISFILPKFQDANLPRSITYFLDTTVQARNMSIEVLKGRSVFNLTIPSSWHKFLSCVNDIRFCSARLLEMHWYRSSEIPEQQSVVLTFAHFRRSEQRFWLRVKRNGGYSWSLNPFSKSVSSHTSDEAMLLLHCPKKHFRQTHREIASLATEYSFITPLHVVLLLRHLRERLRDYDSITFQSWWYASCIWEAVASWMKQAGSQATFRYYSNSDIQTSEIQSPALPVADNSGYEWEATLFSKERLDIYLGKVKLAGYDAHRKEYVKLDLDAVRSYCSEGLLNEALRLAQTNDLMRKKFAMLHKILQSEGRHDKEFNGIAYTTL